MLYPSKSLDVPPYPKNRNETLSNGVYTYLNTICDKCNYSTHRLLSLQIHQQRKIPYYNEMNVDGCKLEDTEKVGGIE